MQTGCNSIYSDCLLAFLAGATLNETETLAKEDLEARVEYLNNVEKKFNDLGPIYDCVLFNNGDYWQACIDTTETGDLNNGILLGEYSKTHQYAPLTEIDKLNISINVHDNGNILEIVGLCCKLSIKKSLKHIFCWFHLK